MQINNRKAKMSRIRLNQEYRNKIANRMRVHLEQENTDEKSKYDGLKAEQIELNDNAWNIAEQIVRKHYTPEDVKKAYYLQNKFESFKRQAPSYKHQASSSPAGLNSDTIKK